MENKSKFVSLKRTLLISSFILFTVFLSQGQSRINPAQDPVERIMKYYPNPAISIITFDFQKGYDKGYSIQVFNFLGKQVYETKNVTPKTTIDLSTYNQGIYIYQLRNKEGKIVESGKFQVSK